MRYSEAYAEVTQLYAGLSPRRLQVLAEAHWLSGTTVSRLAAVNRHLVTMAETLVSEGFLRLEQVPSPSRTGTVIGVYRLIPLSTPCPLQPTR